MPPECVVTDDVEISLNIAALYLEGGFSAAAKNFITRLYAEHAIDVAAMLKIAGFFIDLNELQEAEKVLRDALRLDPSVGSENHLRALCSLAEVKRRLEHCDEAICLCEKVLQHEIGPEYKSSATALLCLCQVYQSIGEFSEVEKLQSRLKYIEGLQTSEKPPLLNHSTPPNRLPSIEN